MYKCPVRFTISNIQSWLVLMFSYFFFPLFLFHLAHRLSQGM